MDPKVEIFMPLYVGDYDRDTADLSFEEHGFYQAILRALWTRGGCLKLISGSASSTEQAGDRLRLARILRTDVETFGRLWPSVEKFFVVRQDGTFFQKRLSHELQKAKENRAFAIDRARKGGEARAAKAALRSAQAQLEADQEEQLQASTSPSPSQDLSSSGSSPLGSSSQPTADLPARSKDGAVFLAPPIRPRMARVGTLTPAFKAVFARYPRRDKEQEASQVFAELADTYPGGEAALSRSILAAFDAGMLKRHPYFGPNETRPCLDRVLAERRWEDPASAPDDAPAKQIARDVKIGYAHAPTPGGRIAGDVKL